MKRNQVTISEAKRMVNAQWRLEIKKNLKNGNIPDKEVICVAFNCATENNLIGVKGGATFNTLNDPRKNAGLNTSQIYRQQNHK